MLVFRKFLRTYQMNDPYLIIYTAAKIVQIRSFFRSVCVKIRTRKNSVFGQFLRSFKMYLDVAHNIKEIVIIYLKQVFMRRRIFVTLKHFFIL